ncbi:M20 family metallopeptidase [Luminiphilus sp.]|nr:M20 aminoacylase family protein [Luminiphilus sp.]MDA9625232.1 M20 family metallopeptidase [Luminiphilus sp.]
MSNTLEPALDISKLVAWRHALHRCPELGFELNETAGYIERQLRELGIETHSEIGQVGLVGVLRKGDSNRAIGLRADMDALKIQELNTFEYRSKTEGHMHACGHDGHSAMLLGAAEALRSLDFDGTVYFVFQPNEEHGLGAQAMIDDGLFDRFPMDAIYGMHNMPGRPAGQLAMKPDGIMAGEDNFSLTIVGRGGHASQPHQHIDPLVISAEIILAMQSIVARSIDPAEQAVVSVTEIEADGTVNVVPSIVTIKGDCRSFKRDVSETIERRLGELAQGICQAHGAELRFSYQRVFHATTNHPAETEHALAAAQATNPAELVEYPCDAMTASDDFAHMLLEKQGAYVFIGNGSDSAGGCALHNPHYDFNDEILVTGVRFWINLVQQQLLS